MSGDSKTSANHWWCGHCRRRCEPAEVTFEECHETCKTPVEWLDFDPALATPARVLAMIAARGWSSHWTHRGAYLHLEASELIEAVRGKRGDVADEAGDVLLVLLSIVGAAGVEWGDVERAASEKLAMLERPGPYRNDDKETVAAETPTLGDPIPAGVYYSRERDNFYSMKSSAGLGEGFYRRWQGRCDEFPPEQPSRLLASGLTKEQREAVHARIRARYGLNRKCSPEPDTSDGLGLVEWLSLGFLAFLIIVAFLNALFSAGTS